MDKTFTKENFFKFAKEFVENTKRVVLAEGKGPPMFAMIFDEKMNAGCVSLETYPSKDIAQAAIKELTKRLNGLGVIFIAESWLLMTRDEDIHGDLDKHVNELYETYESLEYHPERKECICIHAMTRQETKAFYYFIERNDKGKISTLTESPGFGETVTSMGGRMANPFNELTH